MMKNSLITKMFALILCLIMCLSAVGIVQAGNEDTQKILKEDIQKGFGY